MGTPVNTRRKKSDRKEREKKLDQAIEMTFPASDPIAVGRPTSTEAQEGRRSSEPSAAWPPLRRFSPFVNFGVGAAAQSLEPPSTWMVSPVIHRASSDARKAT